MIVLDTNILVRVITKDDVDQAEHAAEILSGNGPFWISKTVLLELGWVLKSSYGFDQDAISRALHLVAALEGAELEDAECSRRALTLHARGIDLGDSFILAGAPEGATVVTFDQKLVSLSRSAGDLPSVESAREFVDEDAVGDRVDDATD